jgi:hypothetical protein
MIIIEPEHEMSGHLGHHKTHPRQLDSNTNHLAVGTKSAYWEFVCNNYSQDIKTLLIHESEEPVYREFIVEEEIGSKCGTPHLQGFIKFNTRKTKATILKGPLNKGILKDRMSFRVVRNIEACKAYVQKDNTVFIKKEEVDKKIRSRNKSKFTWQDLQDKFDEIIPQLQDHDEWLAQMAYDKGVRDAKIKYNNALKGLCKF